MLSKVTIALGKPDIYNMPVTFFHVFFSSLFANSELVVRKFRVCVLTKPVCEKL